MNVKPCLNSKFITCKDGIRRVVPCGKCSACVVNRGIRKANRIKDYISDYHFQYFVTLTFDDKFLPLARLSSVDHRLYHDCDCDFDGVVYSYSLDSSDFIEDEHQKYFMDCLYKYGGIPVLSHRVLINFKKRLRYHLNKNNYGKDLFIYAAGEYGPSTFRPHYHIIFGSKSFIPKDIFESCVRSAWSFCSKSKQGCLYSSFGYIDVQRCFGSKSVDYITKYLCSTSHLPTFLANSKWKPFSCGSTRCDSQLLRLHQSELQDVFSSPAYELYYNRNGKVSLESVPDSYKSRYFPLIPRFKSFNDVDLYRLYSLYLRYPDGEKVFENFLKDSERLIEVDYVKTKRPFTGNDYELYGNTDIMRVVCDCCFRTAHFELIEDEFVKKRNFMRLWYVSRTVCKNAERLDITVSTYVDKIKDYYHKLELHKLKKFYEYQNELLEDVLNPVSLDYIFTLYYNTDENIDIDYYRQQFGWNGVKIEDSVQFKKYKFNMDSILKDTTKTKKRNDKFNSLGLVHKPFVPRIPRLISKFNQI